MQVKAMFLELLSGNFEQNTWINNVNRYQSKYLTLLLYYFFTVVYYFVDDIASGLVLHIICSTGKLWESYISKNQRA